MLSEPMDCSRDMKIRGPLYTRTADVLLKTEVGLVAFCTASMA
jgi:hypothetical protein